jgi:bifunctional NMN adenylyltransferase/nudix hydrolase
MTEVNRESTGVVVARFQTDELHDAHKKLLAEVGYRHNQVIVVLGVARTPFNATNPLPFVARKIMVEQYIGILRQYIDRYKDVHIHVVKLDNERYNEAWSEKLDQLVDSIAEYPEAITYYTGRDGFKPFYTGKYTVEELAFDIICSSTERRHKIMQTPDFESKEFRAGMIYAMKTKHFQTYRTVDMALLYDPGEGKPVEILLAKKPGETGWRFPGGFVEEALNETFAQAAAREMFEETDKFSETGWQLVQDFPMPQEWRIRGQQGVSHSTMLMLGWALTRGGKASDDIAEVRWFTVDEAFKYRHTMFMPEHLNMIEHPTFQRYVL